MSIPEDAVITIERAEEMTGYRIRLTFNDGVKRVVDFGPFLRGSANPLIRAYLQPEAFERFEVKEGDLVWDDYALCFPIADLYEGRV